MGIPGYIASPSYVSSGLVSDLKDPVTGVSYGTTLSEVGNAVIISSHDWAEGITPPSYVYRRDGVNYVFFGTLAVKDIYGYVLRDAKPYPVLMDPVYNYPNMPLSMKLLVPKYIQHAFTQEELDLSADLDVCYGRLNFFGPRLDGMGSVGANRSLREFMEKYQETQSTNFIFKFWNETLAPGYQLGLPKKWNQQDIIRQEWELMYKGVSEVIYESRSVGDGIPYAASFVFADGTESDFSDTVYATGFPLGVVLYEENWEFANADTSLPYALPTVHPEGIDRPCMGDSVDLFVRYIPLDVVKVRYWRYYFRGEAVGFSFMGFDARNVLLPGDPSTYYGWYPIADVSVEGADYHVTRS